MENTKSNTNIRNYGIDLMKVLMTLFICILHIITYGGAQQSAFSNNSTYILLIIIKSSVFCAVNGFAMISGYVGYDAKYRFSRIIWLYATVMVYNFIIPPAIYYSYRDYSYVKITFDDDYVLKGLFPAVFCTSWYFTAYFGMFFLIPFINSAVKNTDRKLALKLLGCLFFFICLLHQIVIIAADAPMYDSYGMNYGQSMMWLTLMYLTGAIVKKHDLFSKVNKWFFLGAYAVLTAAGAGVSLYRYHIYAVDRIDGPNDYIECLLMYDSPITVAQAFCLLMFFSRIKTAPAANRIIAFIVPHTFSIYIIHTQQYAWNYIIKDFYTSVGEYAPLMAAASLLFNALVIFTVCLVIDYPVSKIIAELRILCERIALKLQRKKQKAGTNN